jgi:hypothetical protein
MRSMPLLNCTTSSDAHKTIAEIQQALEQGSCCSEAERNV